METKSPLQTGSEVCPASDPLARRNRHGDGRPFRAPRPATGRAAVWTCALIVAGCGSTGSALDRPGDRTASPREARTTEFVIESHHPGPVIVYALRGTMRIRLGTVTGWRPTRIPLPPDLVATSSPLRLLARPVGDQRHVITDGFSLRVGDTVYWTLVDPLESSVATLRVDLRGR